MVIVLNNFTLKTLCCYMVCMYYVYILLAPKTLAYIHTNCDQIISKSEEPQHYISTEIFKNQSLNLAFMMVQKLDLTTTDQSCVTVVFLRTQLGLQLICLKSTDNFFPVLPQKILIILFYSHTVPIYSTLSSLVIAGAGSK